MKKTIKKRAFISAIAMLIVSAIVLTSSTFAWFSMSKEAQVSSMNLNITTADGISISANTHKFGTTVTVDDIIPTAETAGKNLAADADHTNNIPNLLSPVSSDFALVTGYPVFYSGSIPEGNTTVKVTKLDNDYSGQFVVFDLFVQVSENNTQVKLTDSSIKCDDGNVIKSIRVGLINCGNKEFSEKDATKTITTTLKANTAMWIADGNASDQTKYISSTCGTRDITKSTDGPVAASYSINTSAGTVAKSTNASDFSFIAQQGVNRVRFYLWIEGNDVDCDNPIAGNSFDFNLKLSID